MTSSHYLGKLMNRRAGRSVIFDGKLVMHGEENTLVHTGYEIIRTSDSY